MPTGGVAALILLYFLNLKPTKKRTVREVASTFDFIGLFLLIAGVVLVLIGFQSAETARQRWKAPETVAPLVIGAVLLVLGSINEIYTKKEPVIPPRLFKTRTTAVVLIGGFLHSMTFFSAAYYVPLYFQILGASATMAGVRQLSISLGSSLMAVVSGLLVTKMGKTRPIIWAGFAIMTLGYVSIKFSLTYTFD